MEQIESIKTVSIEELENKMKKNNEFLNLSDDDYKNTFEMKINWDYVRKNPQVAYALALFGDGIVDKKACEKLVVNSRHPRLNYLFARNIKGADIKAHAQAVLDSKSPEYNYLFAKDIEGIDIKAHEQVVLKKKNYIIQFRFAYFVPGADISALGEAVIKSRNTEYNYLFAEGINGANIKGHEEVILANNNPKYSFIFARDVVGADLVAHGKVIARSENDELIHDYECMLQSRANDSNNDQEKIINYNVALWSFRQALLEKNLLESNPTRVRTKDTSDK